LDILSLLTPVNRDNHLIVTDIAVIYRYGLNKFIINLYSKERHMDHENLRKLVELMRGVIGEGHSKAMTIRNSQYNSLYLNIFFNEIEKNGGEATAYDRFGDQLWTDLAPTSRTPH
jgi:hypothetical protein